VSIRLPLLRTARLPPKSVRLSLTDRCDLACVYCRPSRTDGYLEERLERDAFRHVIDGLIGAGVRRIRFTGGEPLLSPHAVELVRHAVDAGAEDVALTTNATLLERHARPLRDAGLMRITISLDTLDAGRFSRITRGGDLARVLRGVDAALAAGFPEVKLNCVVLRGENDDELEQMTRWAWARGIVPRFIEVMPIAEGARVVERHLVSAAEILARLEPLLAPEAPRVDPNRGPAKYVHSRHDPRLRVGVISGTTDTFCDTCDRLRVSAEGMLRPCLASDAGVSVRSLVGHVHEGAITEAVLEAWRQKPDGETWKGCTEESAASLSMRAIGG
jgi:GTP 3',8-cyclase